MKTIKAIIGLIKKAEYSFKTILTTSASVMTGVFFAVYHVYLGIFRHVAWSTAIGVYYLFLAVTRMIIIHTIRVKGSADKRHYEKVYIRTHFLMLFVNCCLIAPITIMIRGEKEYSLGLIPAIAIAAYTTYRITMSIIHYKKTRKNHDILIGEIRLINLTDSLVAVMTLQNTMIIATAGEIAEGMKKLSIASSTVIWVTIMLLTTRSLIKSKKKTDSDII